MKNKDELIQKRKELIFDEEFEYIRTLPIWFNKYGRPCVTISGKNIFIHHLIIDKKVGFDIDHIDGNFLNNKRNNFRYATRSQNLFNKKKRKDSKQKLKGIQQLPGGRYRAKGPNGKHLGCFDTAEEAYDRFIEYSKTLYGEEFVNNSKNI